MRRTKKLKVCLEVEVFDENDERTSEELQHEIADYIEFTFEVITEKRTNGLVLENPKVTSVKEIK